MSDDYMCSRCGATAYYDGRCGDGPVLLCNCAKGQWIDDGRGGYQDNPTGAKAVKVSGAAGLYSSRDEWDWDDWETWYGRPKHNPIRQIDGLAAENKGLRERIRALEAEMAAITEKRTARKKQKRRRA